jgi:hypothetical protein
MITACLPYAYKTEAVVHPLKMKVLKLTARECGCLRGLIL